MTDVAYQSGWQLAQEVQSLREMVAGLQAMLDARHRVSLRPQRSTPFLGQPVTLTMQLTDSRGQPLPDLPVVLSTSWGNLRAEGNSSFQSGTTIQGRTGADGVFSAILLSPTSEDLWDVQQEALENMLILLDTNAATPNEAQDGLEQIVRLYRWEANVQYRNAVDIYFKDFHPDLLNAVNDHDYMQEWSYFDATITAHTSSSDQDGAANSGVEGTAVLKLRFKDWLGPWLQIYQSILAAGSQLDNSFKIIKERTHQTGNLLDNVYGHLHDFVNGQAGIVGKYLGQKVAETSINRFIDTGVSDLPQATRLTVLPALQNASATIASSGTGSLAVLRQVRSDVKQEVTTSVGQGIGTLTDQVKGLQAEVAKKIDTEVFQGALARKVDTTAFNSALAGKVDSSVFTGALAGKLDTATFTGFQKDITTSLSTKVDTATFTSALNSKIDQAALSDALNKKVDTATLTAFQADLTSTLKNKADTLTLTNALATKVDTATFTTAISGKVDTTTFNDALGKKLDTTAFSSFQTEINTTLKSKVDTTVFNDALGKKLDTTTFSSFQNDTNTALKGKVEQTAFNDALGKKVDTTTFNSALATKVDTATFTDGLGKKLDTTAFTGFQKDVTTALSTKVDTAAFTGFQNDITAAVKSKLDTSDFRQFSNTINTNMRTIDERVTNVEGRIPRFIERGDFTDVLKTKVDTTTFNTALATKVDNTTFNTALATKVDTTTFNTTLATKVDSNVFNSRFNTIQDSIKQIQVHNVIPIHPFNP